MSTIDMVIISSMFGATVGIIVWTVLTWLGELIDDRNFQLEGSREIMRGGDD